MCMYCVRVHVYVCTVQSCHMYSTCTVRYAIYGDAPIFTLSRALVSAPHLITIHNIFVARTYPPCWVLNARIQKHRGKPLLVYVYDECSGLFYVHTQHTGPTALRPIRRTMEGRSNHGSVSCSLDTSAATRQAWIRTHILTSELESNAWKSLQM